MTVKEEIEQKAEKKCKLNDQIHRDCYVAGFKEGVKCGLKQHAHDYLVKTKGLKEENNKLLDVINNQDVKITDLEKQIEKMKCCENCKKTTLHNVASCGEPVRIKSHNTYVCDKWELKE